MQNNIQPQNGNTNGNLMNISNQLGANSNVGKVNETAKTVKISGGQELMPVSSGPVINETLPHPTSNPQAPVVEQKPTPPQEQPPVQQPQTQSFVPSQGLQPPVQQPATQSFVPSQGLQPPVQQPTMPNQNNMQK